MDKYQNKYRIQSHRRPNWDYSDNAMYFITLVTQNRECKLGEISKGEMTFSDWGDIVNNEWLKSFEIRQELFLDEYIIMPNHLHAIVILDNDRNENDGGNDLRDGGDPCGGINGDGPRGGNDGDGPHGGNVETHGRASLRPQQPPKPPPPPPSSISEKKSSLIPTPKSISSFVAGFKSAINSKIDDYIDAHNLNIPKYNRNNHFFQPNYHDHIIRNQEEYYRIKKYIKNNPSKWDDDKFHK